LNKTDYKSGKKMANDPAYNLGSQLLAADLNVAAGAGSCPAAAQVINDAQALLAAVKFNATGSYGSNMSPSQVSLANTLAGLLDSYNNNNFGFCATQPTRYQESHSPRKMGQEENPSISEGLRAAFSNSARTCQSLS